MKSSTEKKAAQARASRAYRAANRDKVNAQHLKYRSRPGMAERLRAKSRAYHAAHLEETRAKARHYYAKRVYGLTAEDYEALTQRGACLICSAPAGQAGRWQRLHVDHDHKTGVVRGALCGSCNRGLGCFRDDPERLRRAAQYLLDRQVVDGVA